MSEFLRLVTVEKALELLDTHLKTLTGIETVNTDKAQGRIVAGNVFSPEDLPSFTRSTMDGYAVRASDTYGASEGQPVYLNLNGENTMGSLVSKPINKGEAVKVYTGAMLSPGADSVVMVENTQPVSDSLLEVVRPVAPGENIINIGDDIKAGSRLFSSGHLLRSQDIGGLMALGKTRIEVFCHPRVSIVSTGDEIIAPEQVPQPGQIRDINTYTLSCLTRQSGAIPVPYGIVPDDAEKLSRAASEGISTSEILLISAGSSISTRDMTAKVIASLGKPEIIIHGVSLRPGKPVIIAIVDGKPVFGLPGNPVSAIVVFYLFVRHAIYRTGGCSRLPMLPTAPARITRNIPSTAGREDYVPVELRMVGDIYEATPIFGESNLISIMIRADGMARILAEKNGLEAGELANITLF